jgi:archaellin
MQVEYINKMDQETTQTTIPTINIALTTHRGKPAIELRKVITDLTAIKEIISSAYKDTQIIIQPNFTNKALSINKLIDIGLIYKENGEYFYNF